MLYAEIEKLELLDLPYLFGVLSKNLSG